MPRFGRRRPGCRIPIGRLSQSGTGNRLSGRIGLRGRSGRRSLRPWGLRRSLREGTGVRTDRLGYASAASAAPAPPAGRRHRCRWRQAPGSSRRLGALLPFLGPGCGFCLREESLEPGLAYRSVPGRMGGRRRIWGPERGAQGSGIVLVIRPGRDLWRRRRGRAWLGPVSAPPGHIRIRSRSGRARLGPGPCGPHPGSLRQGSPEGRLRRHVVAPERSQTRLGWAIIRPETHRAGFRFGRTRFRFWMGRFRFRFRFGRRMFRRDRSFLL